MPRTPEINASSSHLASTYPPMLIRLVKQELGIEGKVFCMSSAQLASWEERGLAMFNAYVEQSEREQFLIESIRSVRTMAGLPILVFEDIPLSEIRLEDGRGQVLGKITALAIPCGYEITKLNEGTNA